MKLFQNISKRKIILRLSLRKETLLKDVYNEVSSKG